MAARPAPSPPARHPGGPQARPRGRHRWPAAWRPGWGGAAVLVGLAVQLVPLLAFPTVLTQDGPAHLDGAWVLDHWHDGGAAGEALRTHYRLDLSPVPNMLTTFVLAGLLRITGPDVAERLLAVGLAVGLVAAAAYAVRGVDRRAGWLVLGAVPLAGSLLAAYGFYNFQAGVIGLLLVLGFALRRPAGWSAGGTLVLALLLTATWTAHLMPWALAAGGAGVLGLARTSQDRREGVPPLAAARRHLLPVVLAALPSVVLSGVYELSGAGPAGTPGGWPSVVRVLTLLVGRRPFMAGNPWEWPAVVLTALALWGLLVAAWRRGRPAAPTPGPALGWLLVLATAVVLLIPSRLGDDFGYLADRAAWFPVLLLLLWAATRLPGRRAAVAIGAALLVAGCGLVVARLPAQTAASREVDEVMSVAPELPRGAAFVVLRYVKAPPGHLAPDPLRHVSSRLATRTGGVDIGHYEAVTAYFQVTFDGGPDLRRRLDPSATGLERVPPAVDLAAVRGRLDYVLVVGLDRATPAARHAARTLAVQRELETYYRRVATSAATGLVTVWRATPQPEVSVP